jgi:hypothetical protein
MFTNISWLQFFMVAAPVISAYYLYVAIRYYRSSIQELLNRHARENDPETFDDGKDIAAAEHDPPLPVSQEEPLPEADDELQFDLIEKLVGELKARITQAGRENLMKGELAAALSENIRNYPELRNTPYKRQINELILFECAQQKITALSEADAEMLW